MRYKRELFTGLVTSRDDRDPSEVHLSRIIKYMLKALDPERFGREADDNTRRLWELGFAVEHAISTSLTLRYCDGKPGIVLQSPLQEDGIHMTPDAFDTRNWRLIEIKYTAISSNREIVDPMLRHWLWQVKAYARALDTRKADIVSVHAFGDYSHGTRVITPYLHSLTFSQAELDSNWSMILRNRDRMLREEAA